jgi:hypothetical protein
MFFDLPLSPYCSWRDVPCAKYCLRSFQRPFILLGFSSLLPQAENKKGNENYLTFLWELFDRLRLRKMWMSGRKLWREHLRQLLMPALVVGRDTAFRHKSHDSFEGSAKHSEPHSNYHPLLGCNKPMTVPLYSR